MPRKALSKRPARLLFVLFPSFCAVSGVLRLFADDPGRIFLRFVCVLVFSFLLCCHERFTTVTCIGHSSCSVAVVVVVVVVDVDVDVDVVVIPFFFCLVCNLSPSFALSLTLSPLSLRSLVAALSSHCRYSRCVERFLGLWAMATSARSCPSLPRHWECKSSFMTSCPRLNNSWNAINGMHI